MSGNSGKNFDAAEAKLRLMQRPLLLTHVKPDGDALGALGAMRMHFRSLGGSPTALLFEPLPDRYRFLENHVGPVVYGRDIHERDLASFDGVVVLDTCTYSQLDPLAAWLRSANVLKIAIDHHVTRDELADVYVIDEPAAATCLMLYEWAVACDWASDAAMAELLLLGIATDTGWFKHSNTDARALCAAGDLVRLGAVPNDLFGRLYQQESVARFRLRALAHGSLELHCRDRLAVMSLSQAAFQAAGATMGDTEEIVSDPLIIGSTVLSAMFVEQQDGLIRIGFRSRAPRSQAEPDVDVAAIAQTWGGGGHRRAAGARIRGSLESIRAGIVAVLAHRLEGL